MLIKVERSRENGSVDIAVGLHRKDEELHMRVSHVVLASVGALVVSGPALANCPVNDATTEKVIASQPEFREGRTLRSCAICAPCAMRLSCSTLMNKTGRASGLSPF